MNKPFYFKGTPATDRCISYIREHEPEFNMSLFLRKAIMKETIRLKLRQKNKRLEMNLSDEEFLNELEV